MEIELPLKVSNRIKHILIGAGATVTNELVNEVQRRLLALWDVNLSEDVMNVLVEIMEDTE